MEVCFSEALKISTLFICYKIEKFIEYYLVITLIYSMNKREEYCESIVILRDDNLTVMQLVLFLEIFNPDPCIVYIIASLDII